MVRTTYFWDEETDNVLMESDDQGNVTQYTQKPELYGKVLSQNRNGTKSFYHYDGQGSVRQVTDSTGTVTDSVTYTAFGEVVSKTGSTVNPWGYKGAMGYYANPGSEDLYVRARMLSPMLGRWLSVGVNFASNLYAYSKNSPTGFDDPSSLAPENKPYTVLDRLGPILAINPINPAHGFVSTLSDWDLIPEEPVRSVPWEIVDTVTFGCAGGISRFIGRRFGPCGCKCKRPDPRYRPWKQAYKTPRRSAASGQLVCQWTQVVWFNYKCPRECFHPSRRPDGAPFYLAPTKIVATVDFALPGNTVSCPKIPPGGWPAVDQRIQRKPRNQDDFLEIAMGGNQLFFPNVPITDIFAQTLKCACWGLGKLSKNNNTPSIFYNAVFPALLGWVGSQCKNPQ